MELLNELKLCIRTLEKEKCVCLKEALKSDDDFADVTAGQYVAYASYQDTLIDLVMKYERSAKDNGRNDVITA